MKFLLHYTALILALFLMAGCATSKSFAKKGAKLEEAGMMSEAAQMYYTSLQKNRGNVDAQIGMKKTGQVVLNKMLQEFVTMKTFDDKRKAVAEYQAAERYVNQVKSLGVNLEIPDFYRTDFEEVKHLLINELYDEGISLLDDGKYQDAEARFNEIAKLDPEHPEASDLAAIAYCEPLYKKGMESFELEYYRAAHDNFQMVMSRIPTYKDAPQYRQEALDLGLFTVAMLPFENSTIRNGLDAKVEAYALEALTGVDDPFLKIVDRDNIELILEEQKLGLSGVIDEETAVSVGELIGAQAILTGTVLGYNREEGDAIRTEREAYEQYKVKKLNKETNKYYYETKYRKTNYDELSRRNRVTVSFQYKLISLKTGEILKSKIVDREVTDQATWAEYDGELNTLYPARSNGVSLNARARQNLHNQMSANRNPRSAEDLTNDAFQQVSRDMKGDIAQLLKELVK
ncbi:CsgG/HfaB family protein [Sanyastnella coralliicola]|uniref:CsgG/HfaB family protein n=1 Tax=Sanyastnella coralliicola TaxID=3069118 RepID=UPI0027B8D914|nr:CsgG/HfaB family protein [Longitalea sp. SCSIO 12813]